MPGNPENKPMGTELKKLLAANMLTNGITAALAVVVPLYLIDRKVDLGIIGLILAIGPFTFMVMRIIFASLSDGIGTKIVTVFYSILNIAAVVIYTISASISGFSLAMLVESLRTSAFWAVNRTEVINEGGGSGHSMAFFSAMRQLADALGRFAGGILLAFLAFQNSFIAILILSIVLLLLVLSYKPGKNPGKSNLKRHGNGLIKRILKPHPQTFWHAATLMSLMVFLPNVFLAFVLPLFSHSFLGFGYWETGAIVAVFSLVTAVAMTLSARWRINLRTLMWLTLPGVPALALLPFSGALVVLTLLVVAISCSCCIIMAEYILVDQIFRSKDISTDIGLLFMPTKALETLFLASGGFVIASFGYLPLFLFLAMIIMLLFFLGRSLLK